MHELNSPKFKDLVKRAIALWGQNSQFDMLHEEIGELMTAISHYRRNRISKGQVLEEIMGVEQMLFAIANIYGFNTENMGAQRKIELAKFERNLLLAEAKALASERHEGQTYQDKPYTFHLNKVAEVVKRFGFDNPDLYVSAWLHDIIEDTDTELEEITEKFGAKISSIVWAVTDEPGKNRATRKALTYKKIKFNRDSTIVKLADRIANVEVSLSEPKFLAMYKKEHPKFKEGIRTNDPLLEPMWKVLDEYLKDDSHKVKSFKSQLKHGNSHKQPKYPPKGD